MSTKGSSTGPGRAQARPSCSEGLAPSRGQMLTAYFAKMRPLDQQQVRQRHAEMNRVHVPLRRLVYRRLLSEFNTAQQKGYSLQQVIDDLKARAGVDPEAALLLRDIWEVTEQTEAAIANNRPTDTVKALAGAAARLLNRPFGGNEVLF